MPIYKVIDIRGQWDNYGEICLLSIPDKNVWKAYVRKVFKIRDGCMNTKSVDFEKGVLPIKYLPWGKFSEEHVVKEESICVTYEMEKESDRVGRNTMWCVLDMNNVNGNLLNGSKNLLAENKACVKECGLKSDWF